MFKRFFGKKNKEDSLEQEIEKIFEETSEKTEAEDISEASETAEEPKTEQADAEYSEKTDEPEENEEKNISGDEKKEPAEDALPFEQAEDTAEENSDLTEEKDENEETAKESKDEKNGFFARLKQGLSKTRNNITQKIDSVFSGFKTIDDDLYDELEEVLIMADIGAKTAAYILEELRKQAKEQNIKEAEELKNVLKEIISGILSETNSEMNLSGNPAVIMVIGVNGVGKTTSIGKMAAMYKKMGKKVILAAADTFRAAAIDQLEMWAERAGADIVKHKEGSDPSAVVFDAIASAKAKKADIVICDTAGRLHNKKPLMEELKKISRVIERETGSSDFESLLVLDASTGQNALIQAREFASAAAITGVVLTKLDGTAKGGVIIPLAKEQNIGVKFIGVGEKTDDLRPFDAAMFAEALFGAE